MPDAFLDLSTQEQSALLRQGAVKMGLPAQILEKDIWVCWSLHALFALPKALPMAFKGGTSLSKAYGIIDRFSEDLDITIHWKSLDSTSAPFASGTSKSQRKKISDDLRDKAKSYVETAILPWLTKQIAGLPSKFKMRVELNEDGESLSLYYASVLGNGADYVQDRVLLEFGGRNEVAPQDLRPIYSYLKGQFPLDFPEAKVPVLSPTRTFWEKVTLIHAACSKGSTNMADRQARHWYDLSMLAKHPLGKQALQDRNLLKAVVELKQVFYADAKAQYEACLQGQCRLVPEAQLLGALEADYLKMQRAGMFPTEPPAFKDVMGELKKLEEQVNRG